MPYELVISHGFVLPVFVFEKSASGFKAIIHEMTYFAVSAKSLGCCPKKLC